MTLTPVTISFDRRKSIKTLGMHATSMSARNMLKTRQTKYIASHSAILLKTVKFMISKNVNKSLLACTITLKLYSVLRLKARSCNIVRYRQHIANIVAAEKRPLSYQTPQSVHRARNCCVQTLPLTVHYRREKLGENWGRNCRILTPTNSILPDYGAKFH